MLKRSVMIIQLPAKEKLYLIKHGTGISLNVVFSVKGWGIGLGLLHNVHSLFKRPRHPLHFNLSVAKKLYLLITFLQCFMLNYLG